MVSMRKQMDASKAKEFGRSRPPTPIPLDNPEWDTPTDTHGSGGSKRRERARSGLGSSHLGSSEPRQGNQQVDTGATKTLDGKIKERTAIEQTDRDGHGTIRSLARRPLTTVYDQAVQRVQEWNEALNGPFASSPYFVTTLLP
jgi:hypothetical protein